jgi:D-proline reductase (dithiol) PrdB
VGLVQREVERAGISTIGITIVRTYTERVRPPRSVFLEWPFGHPLGKPFNRAQQAAVLAKTFQALYEIQTPGEIRDLPFGWKQETYSDEGWTESLRDLRGG